MPFTGSYAGISFVVLTRSRRRRARAFGQGAELAAVELPYVALGPREAEVGDDDVEDDEETEKKEQLREKMFKFEPALRDNCGAAVGASGLQLEADPRVRPRLMFG
ncbi:hypothetical protein MMC11_000595 [Xylographa trunciseda]|nr:hypothetical protein [Xylographa trunciseda]